jgi:hypothetical protein
VTRVSSANVHQAAFQLLEERERIDSSINNTNSSGGDGNDIGPPIATGILKKAHFR